MNMIIYGAQGYALGTYNAIKNLFPDRKVLFFMVTSMEGNATELGGLPVRKIKDVSKELSVEDKKNIHVIIATPENVQDVIEETLEDHGFYEHSRLTSERWDELMSRANAKTGKFSSLHDLSCGNNMPRLNIYMARSHKDKPLKNAISLPDYMHPIQVGAANTDEAISEIRDDIGKNISEKNVNYCELTGLYWVWKNVLCKANECGSDKAQAEYYGFAQYRRTLIMSDEDLRRIAANDIDVVLPFPLQYEPDIDMHHKRYIKDADWDALLAAISELQPDYALAFPGILHQEYMYNYNVILAKKEVLRDYCKWLFPILARTEELSDPKGCDRSDRYIGYMGETLETLYFMKNKDRLNIAHTGCKLHV